MKFIIIGSGSSAKKFIKILLEQKHQVTIYKHRSDLEVPTDCQSIDNLKNLKDFDGGIISSPTAFHLKYALPFVRQKLPTLIEKPISDKLAGVQAMFKLANKNKALLMTGFNLRHLPIIEKIKQYIEKNKLGDILHADLYVGQYLPEWRPWLDYRQNYSASHTQGGGVSLDLIHEIDLALHFFPNIKLQSIFSDKLGDLEIDTEDFVVFQTNKKPFVSVRMDYLNHVKTRQYRIVGTNGSISCDIFNKSFEFRSKTGKQEIITDPQYFDIPTSFKSEIDSFISSIKHKKVSITERSLGIDALKISIKGRKYVQR